MSSRPVIVSRPAVESVLREGSLGCPVSGCAGRLAPWGWARSNSARPRRFSVGGTYDDTADVVVRNDDDSSSVGATRTDDQGVDHDRQ